MVGFLKGALKRHNPNLSQRTRRQTCTLLFGARVAGIRPHSQRRSKGPEGAMYKRSADRDIESETLLIAIGIRMGRHPKSRQSDKSEVDPGFINLVDE